MQLRELLKGVDVIQVVGSEDVDVKDIAYHTKDVNDDCCFVAISGNAVDGHDYVDMAIENGATVVVSNRPTGVPKGTVNVIVKIHARRWPTCRRNCLAVRRKSSN